MTSLMKNFMFENKNKFVRLIFANGFQLKGRLVEYDESYMLINTSAYDSPPVLVPYTAVTTFVPTKN